MAALQALINAKEVAEQAKKSELVKKKSFRVVADPLISAKQLENIIAMHVSWTGDKDIFSQIHPPASSPRSVGWNSRPDAAWLEKTAGLIYDYVSICTNGKIVATKHQVAIRSLLADKVITKPEGTVEAKFVDDVDILIRLVLKMYRSTKNDEGDYKRVMAKVGNKGALKIQAVLDKLKVEADSPDEDPSESSPVPVYTAPLGPNPAVPKVPSSWENKNGVEELGFPATRLSAEEGGNVIDDSWGFPTKRLKCDSSLAMVAAKPSQHQRNMHKPRLQIVPLQNVEEDDDEDDDAFFSEIAASFRSCEADGPVKKKPAAAKAKPTKPTKPKAKVKPTAVSAKQSKGVKKESGTVKEAPQIATTTRKIATTTPAPCVVQVFLFCCQRKYCKCF